MRGETTPEDGLKNRCGPSSAPWIPRRKASRSTQWSPFRGEPPSEASLVSTGRPIALVLQVKEEIMKRACTYIGTITVALAVAALPGQAQNQEKDNDKNAANRIANIGGKGQDRVSREVRHELVMLPYYGVFDNLAYRVDDGTVSLYGQVTRPTLKSDAENVVKGIEGVTRVDNQIQVLPLSSMDEGIRVAEYRTIFGKPGLDRYAMQAVPPIHIIVDNGKVTLEGVVANENDKNQAGIYANTVSSVFSVTNNLRVEGERK